MAWSQEQRKAASDRMRERMARRREVAAEVAKLTPAEVQAEVNEVRSAQVDEVNAALAMVERPAAPTIDRVPPVRTRSTEYRIIANSDGKMVSQDGPCLCGVGKREWHEICLEQ